MCVYISVLPYISCHIIRIYIFQYITNYIVLHTITNMKPGTMFLASKPRRKMGKHRTSIASLFGAYLLSFFINKSNRKMHYYKAKKCSSDLTLMIT